jgi:pSer/pThr/pTyr-binding forkhead associated (FHA) protein
VELNSGHAEVADLSSFVGTFVNGVRISKCSLVHGDVLLVGKSELVFLSEEEDPAVQFSVLV